MAELGVPLRLKVSLGGYDGRGQVRIGGPDDLPDAEALVAREAEAGRPLLLERELDFELECSTIVARAVDGLTTAFPAARNRHDAGILVESSAPAELPAETVAQAAELASNLATGMGLVGLLTVELFLMRDGSLVVNELAPRVHNSGHWTMEAAATSQFEQHIRAICGLALGPAHLRVGGAATVNLLGTGADRVSRVAGVDRALDLEGGPDVHVHLYDKRRVFERRKMGHVNAVAGTREEALRVAHAAASRVRWADDDAGGAA
jgi:5-(carboxyamino)imidazole ribonucleotide synthase